MPVRVAVKINSALEYPVEPVITVAVAHTDLENACGKVAVAVFALSVLPHCISQELLIA